LDFELIAVGASDPIETRGEKIFRGRRMRVLPKEVRYAKMELKSQHP
jgi:hypothetical protein